MGTFPKLDILVTSELLGSFSRRLFIGAMQLNTKLNMAVRPN
jgi:hypothetical protein